MTAPTQSLKGLDLLAEIERLKHERNAVILAHYYQKPEIQDLADFVGDSLDLSRKAAATDADVIAFCGVRFMAETAKILSPEKIVILPDMDAGCCLEDSCPPDQFKAFREAHPDHIALTYINCSAAVKALQRHHRHQLVAPTIILEPDPEGPEDHLRPRPASRRLSRAQDRPRHAAVAGHLHRPPGFQRDRAAEAQGRASRRAGRGASRMPAAHHRPCRPCRLDQVDPRLRARLARRRRSWSRPSRTSSTRWRRPRRTRPSSASPGGDGNCNCNMCPYMALNTLEKLYVALRDLQPRIELSRRSDGRGAHAAGADAGDGRADGRAGRRRECRRSAATKPAA